MVSINKGILVEIVLCSFFLFVLIISLVLLDPFSNHFLRDDVLDLETNRFPITDSKGISLERILDFGRKISNGRSHKDSTSKFSARNIEFKCYGSCYCQEEIERRSVTSPNLLEKGLILLVTSVSATVAYGVAKEHFRGLCMTKFSSQCGGSEYVIPEIDNCDDTNEIPTEVSKETDEEKVVKKWWCEGSCVPKSFYPHGFKFGKHKVNNPIKERFAQEFGCEKLKKEGEVVIDFAKYLKILPRYPKESYFLARAKSTFIRTYLKGYCERNSMIMYNYDKMEEEEFDSTIIQDKDADVLAIVCCKPSNALTRLNPTVQCEEQSS